VYAVISARNRRRKGDLVNEIDALDEGARERRIADRKMIRDFADFVFRVVQMWIVLALVVFMQRQTGSAFATAVMLVLSGALFLYCMFTPIFLVEEWEVSRGKELHGIVWLGVLLALVALMLPLMFSDPILEEMNRLAHGSAATSGAGHHP